MKFKPIPTGEELQAFFRAFIAKAVEGASDECWLWPGSYSVNNGGHKYGNLSVNGECYRVTRIAWRYYRGTSPDGFEVCHKCDVTLCCNPDHLFLGTHSDNMRDCDRKGRRTFIRGEIWERDHAETFTKTTGDNHHLRREPWRIKRGDDSPFSKLTEDQVREIKRAIKDCNGRRGICAQLGRQYGVAPEAISHIKLGKNWSHVAV